MKDKIKIENLDIPSIQSDEITKIIIETKKYYLNRPLQKYEPKKYAIFKILTRYCFFVLLFETLICLCLLFIAANIFSVFPNIKWISFMFVSTIITSTVYIIDIVYAKIVGSMEMELSSPLSMTYLIIYKIIIITLFTIISLILISLYLQNQFNLSFYALLYSGCIPFFIINTIYLLLIDKTNFNSLFFVYSFTLIFIMILSICDETKLIHILNNNGLELSIISFMVYLVSLLHRYKEGIQYD